MHDIEPLNIHQYAMRCRCNRLFVADVVSDPDSVIECHQCGDKIVSRDAVKEYQKRMRKMKKGTKQ